MTAPETALKHVTPGVVTAEGGYTFHSHSNLNQAILKPFNSTETAHGERSATAHDERSATAHDERSATAHDKRATAHDDMHRYSKARCYCKARRYSEARCYEATDAQNDGDRHQTEIWPHAEPATGLPIGTLSKPLNRHSFFLLFFLMYGNRDPGMAAS